MITDSIDQDIQLPNNNVHPFKSQFEDRTLIFIYQITCKDPNIKENYIGQTESFEDRKYAHGRDSKTSDLKIYQTIRKHGGWDNWEMKVMNEYYCKDEYEARQIEQKYIDIFKCTMNSARAYSKSFIDQELDRQLEFELCDFSEKILGCYLYDYLDYDFSQELTCEFCNKILTNAYTLKTHQKLAKYCLKIQGKIEEIPTVKKEYNCEDCKKTFFDTHHLAKHLETCKIKDKNITYELKDENKETDYECKDCFTFFKCKQNLKMHSTNCKATRIRTLKECEIEKLKEEVNKITEKNIELNNIIKNLEAKIDIYKSDHGCVHEIAKQPRITNNNNKYLLLQPFDITKAEMKRKVYDYFYNR